MSEDHKTAPVAHTARQVASRLLELADASGAALTPMQLIKLVYLCHGWMLGLYGRPLISEPVEAWAYGPVIRDLYAVIKQFRSSSVKAPIVQNQPAAPFSELEEDVIQQTYNGYGRMSGLALSRLTHAEGTPWSITYNLSRQNSVISNDLIQDHFASLATQHAAA